MNRRIKAGSTDQSVVLRIMNSTTFVPETSIVFNSAGIDIWYRREGAAKVSITEATLSALTDAHSDGGFLHIGDGYYRLDLPDAAVAAGSVGVQIGGTVTGGIIYGPYCELIAYDQYDGAGLGLSRIDAAITTRATPAQVNTEVLDVLAVDTRAEPGQGNPPATTSLALKIDYNYKFARNKCTQTQDTEKIFSDDESTVDHKSVVSFDGATYTRGEIKTGP